MFSVKERRFLLKILKGNLNTYSTEKRFLHRPILAERIRIVPFSSRWRTVCLRVEIYGCSMEKNFSTLSSDKIESTFITFPSLIFFVVFLVLFCSIPFLIGYFLRIFFQKSSTISTENSYSKCSRLKPISSPSNRNRERKRNFDDIVSMGSYIYPITSTTSIRQTSSPSSMFKSDHYAVIDHPTTSNSVEKYSFCVFHLERFFRFSFRFVITRHRIFLKRHRVYSIVHRLKKLVH